MDEWHGGLYLALDDLESLGESVCDTLVGLDTVCNYVTQHTHLYLQHNVRKFVFNPCDTVKQHNIMFL